VILDLSVADFNNEQILLFCRGNIKEAPHKKKKRYLNKCHYDEDKDPYCPNFRLGYIANQARENFTELCRTVSIRLALLNVSVAETMKIVAEMLFFFLFQFFYSFV